MEKTFRVGDRVEITSSLGGMGAGDDYYIAANARGTVLVTGISIIGVEWDKYMGGHELDGRCRRGYGWYFSNDGTGAIPSTSMLNIINEEGQDFFEIDSEMYNFFEDIVK